MWIYSIIYSKLLKQLVKKKSFPTATVTLGEQKNQSRIYQEGSSVESRQKPQENQSVTTSRKWEQEVVKGTGSPWLNSSLFKAPEIFGREPKEEYSDIELSTQHGAEVEIFGNLGMRGRVVPRRMKGLEDIRWQALGLNHHDIQGLWQFDLILFWSHFSPLLENFFY